MPSFEVLLCLGAAAFYLYDASVLLHANELILEKRGSSWRCVTATQGIRLLRKSLFMPNPLRPDLSQYLLIWVPRCTLVPVSLEHFQQFEARLTSLKVLSVTLLLLLLALPLVLACFGMGKVLLVLLGLYYLTLVIALLLLLYQRCELGLAWSQWASWAIECLLCPPLAVNLLRQITRAAKGFGDPLMLAKQLLPKDEAARLLTEIVAQLEERLEIGSARHDELQRFRQLVREIADER